jgi:hypothetical protein
MCFSVHFEWDGGTGSLDCEVTDALPPTGNEEAVRNRIRGEHKKVRFMCISICFLVGA